MIEPRTQLDVDVSAENAFLWQVACHWRNPQPLIDPSTLNWQTVVQTAIKNKMPMLLYRYLQAIDVQLPVAAADQLEASVEAYQSKAATFTMALRDYMNLAAERDVPTVPLKGLWVAERVYGQSDMRPGHDMDILVRRQDVARSVKICEQLGFNRYWPGLLPDDYYLRHHLHIELSLTDCWTWIEVHWAFDHPRTLLTIDYDGLFNRATTGRLLGATIAEPTWEDVLLSLSIHLVKHMVFLPAVLARSDLPDLVLADGRMMHFLDVAEAVKQFHEVIDWQLLVRLATESGAVASMGAVLHVCQRLFDAPVPPFVLTALAIPPQDRLTRKLYQEMANHLIGQSQSKLWGFLVEPNWKF
ncbi:MAG: nucleotidyltransferase family protein, partial [Candidatus Promineifilaceae bacterium]